MDIKILKEYCIKCKAYGWQPSWEGLKAYKEIKEKGLIKLWSV